MFRRHYFSFFFIVVIGLAALTILLDQITKPSQQPTDSDLHHQPDYIIENISGLRIDHTKSVQRLFYANALFHYLDQNLTHLEHIDFQHFKPGTSPFRVSANHAEILENGKDIFLKNHVTAIRGNDDDKGQITLETNMLHLIPDQEHAKTNQPVTISRLNTTVSAVGMHLDNQTGVIELLSRVRAVDR